MVEVHSNLAEELEWLKGLSIETELGNEGKEERPQEGLMHGFNYAPAEYVKSTRSRAPVAQRVFQFTDEMKIRGNNSTLSSVTEVGATTKLGCLELPFSFCASRKERA